MSASVKAIVFSAMCLIWSSTWLMIKVGLRDAPPFTTAGMRFAVALIAIAPLAFAMGHLFPAGLRRLNSSAPELVPWAWAVNGCASVAAALGAPLLAMETGFGCLILLAALCYALAGLLGPRLPPGPGQEEGSGSHPS